jgi:hypothetical protein
MVHVFNTAYLSTDPAALSPLLLGVITLIHKGKTKPRDRIASYRPITLLGCDVKLLSMVLLERLQGLADHVVDISQGAFLQGRDISKNIQYHLGLLDFFKATQHPVWVILTDLEAAYDSANRDFFFQALRNYGFEYTNVDVRWFELFLTGTRLCFTINGHLTEDFPSERGFPQGLNLSTMIWLLHAQTWHARANQLVETGLWLRPSLPEEFLRTLPDHFLRLLIKNHLISPFTMFADDIPLIESEATLDTNLPVQKGLFQDIQAGAGIKLSIPKWCGSGGTGVEQRDNLGEIPVVATLDDVRSLGIPVHHSFREQRKLSVAKYPGAFIGANSLFTPLQPNLLERGHICRTM